ncbi:hypothetical protein [Pluralibacter gergoviae]|uniref:hypothetical protein n=1 Tax=Pluralibacter gergoviae TaxID=61647 RepID=UPI0006AC5F11|nr:hypothetical protein [Pluralibacter gergoviae]KOR04341.1 hypothetical protein ABW48_03725 [Pluralibacter gergoviae]
MLKQKKIEAVIDEMSRQLGHELNGQDRLLIRTKTALVLAAKQRHRQRMEASPYQWKKPERRRR